MLRRRRLRSSKQRPIDDVVVGGGEEANNVVRTYKDYDDYDQEEDARRNVNNRNNEQMRFNHVLMSGDRNGGGRYVDNNKRSPQHEDVQHDDRRGRSENILNSVQVQIVTPPPPSRHQPHSQSHTSLTHTTHTTATATSTTFNRQERARQKLDNLSRQHQFHQYEQQRRFHNNQNTFTTNGEEGEGTAADYCSTSLLSRTTADTSDTTTLQLQSNYDSLMNTTNNSSNIYRIPIVSTAATCGIEENIINPRIPISCNNANDNDDGNTAESSYYSKHDFHTLPRISISLNELDADGNNEIDNNDTAVLREKQQRDGKKPTISKNQQQPKQSQPRPRVCILHSSTDYSPKPPSKRSATGSGGRRQFQLQEQQEERNQVKDDDEQQQVQVKQQQNHDFDYQPTPPSKRSGYLLGRSNRMGKAEERRKYKIGPMKQPQENKSVTPQIRQTNAKGIERKVKIVDKNNNVISTSDAELNDDDVVTTPTKPMKISMEGINDRVNGGSDDNALLQSTTPDTSYDNIWSLPAVVEVTPSPTKSKLHHDLKQPNEEEEPQHQPMKLEKRSQTPTPAPNASSTVVVDPPSSTAPTAKIGNNSQNMLTRLLRRHQKSKPRSARMQTFQQMKQQVDDDEERDRRERERDGLEINKARMENVRTNKSVGGEPPEEENISVLRPDPPPDPPEQHVGQQPRATYKHYNSKVMEHTQSIQQHQPQQPPAEYRHYTSTVLERSRSQPQFTKASSSSKPITTNKKNSTTTELQPPSQLNVKPKSQKQLDQQKLRVVSEWSTPIPFKKVNSTPSNFSSFFTTQTQNTTSSSQFWEQVEEFSDPTYSKKSKDDNNNIRKKQNVSTNVGKSQKEKDEYFESHGHNRLSSEKVGRRNNIQHPKHQQQQQQPATQYVMEEAKPTPKSNRKKSRSTSSPKKSPRSSTGKDNSGLESINEDEISNAFSLQLPMDKGGFDEISALQMNDSATVYFQQQLNGGVANDNAVVGNGKVAAANVVDTDPTNDVDYWKQRFLELQQKTEALELSRSKEDDAELIALQQHHELLQKDSQELEQEIMDIIQDENEEGKQVELNEIINQYNPATDVQHLQHQDKEGADVYGSLEETYDTPGEDNYTQQTESILNEIDEDQRQRLGERCTTTLDVFEGINQFLDGVVDLDNCELDTKQFTQQGQASSHHGQQQEKNHQKQDYGGGKKGRGDYNGGKKGRLERDKQKPQRITVASVGKKCASDVGLSKEEVVHTMKKTAEEMQNFVHKIEESKSGKKVKRELQKGRVECNTEIQRMCATEMQDIANDLMRPEGIGSSAANQRNVTSSPVQCNDSSEQNENDVRLDASFETDEDFVKLRPIGYVPLESDNDNAQQPSYVMDDEDNDVALLQSWNNSRKVTSPKSLADDLTAGASRLSHGVTTESACTEQSELSENAKKIFQAALKYDMKTLNAVKRFNKSRSSSPAHRGGAGGDGEAVVQHSEQRMSSPGEASNFSSNIPSDFATWFELPSPGSICIPLLPLLNVSLRNSIDIFDSSDLSPKFRADDVANLSYADFVSQVSQEILMGNDDESDIFKQSMGPIIADGDDGSVRFANASIHLIGISNAAIAAISRRDFGDAVDIYNTLLRSCQTSKGSKLGLVGQLIASTLHNLSVLHLWNQEYEEALPYCRESLRIKNELGDDGGSSVNQWATMGLVNYATGPSPSALAAFRKANQMASKFDPNGNLTGRLVNNMACVNFDIGKLPLVQSQFKQALQLQKGDGNDEIGNTDISFSGGEDLFSISLTLFNLGVVFAAQNESQGAAALHLNACYAIQQALLESNSEVVRSTAYYIDSMKNYSPASTSKLAPKKSEPNLPQATEPPHNFEATQRTDDQQYTEPQVDKFVQQEEEGERGNQYLEQEKTEPEPEQNVQELRSSNVVAPTVPAQPLPSPANVFTTRASQRNPFIQEGDQISHPMLSLGSLRVTQTTAQRVQLSLEGCSDNPSSILHGIGRARDLSLLCRRPPISSSSHRTVSQNIINYGLHTIKKREAQSELQRNLQRYGPRHPEVGKSHNSLGVVYLFSENYIEAVAHFEASIRINSNALGPKHQDVASTLMFKGIAELALEQLDDSLMSMIRVRRTREEFLGLKHPEIGSIMNNIACVQYELGEFKSAELLFQEALDLQREVFSTDPTFLKGVSIVLCNIAFLHAKCGEFPKALIELEGALQIRQDILLEDNTLSDITANMAHILAIHQLQHGACNLEEITEEYITMLSNKSGGSSNNL